ncbi:MAG: hypothetical protein ACXQS6_03365 [Candidatus Syntropharchaeales archaeon]
MICEVELYWQRNKIASKVPRDGRCGMPHREGCRGFWGEEAEKGKLVGILTARRPLTKEAKQDQM